MLKKNVSTLVPALFFAAWFILVFFFLYKDYGLPTDDLTQRGTGGVSAKYVVSKLYPSYVQAHPELNALPDLKTYGDRDYGVGFELPAVIIEKALGYEDNSPEMVGFRHRLKFILFFLATLLFYDLAKRRFGTWKWALLAVGMLVFFPRIFADSIYNSKDAVFLSACMIAMWAMIRFLDRRTVMNAVVFGLASAFATDIRIIAFIFPLMALGVMAFETIRDGKIKETISSGVKCAVALLFSYCIFLYVMWPFLWEDPVGNFLLAFKNMSVFRGYDGSFLFLGNEVRAHDLPWIYAPVWMLVTIPVFVLVGFVSGAVVVFASLIRNKFRLYSSYAERTDLIFLAFTVLPIILAIIKHSVLYDGWRHLYFEYATFVLIATLGLKKIYDFILSRVAREKQFIGKSIAAVLLILQFGWLGAGMIRNHPYECVYFNIFAGSPAHIENNFVLDYWGLSYPEMLKTLAASKERDSSKTVTGNYPGITNYIFLDASEKEKIIFTEKKYAKGIPEATYFVGFNQAMYLLPPGKELASIHAYGIKINNIVKRDGLPVYTEVSMQEIKTDSLDAK